jgi:hypothetical protein
MSILLLNEFNHTIGTPYVTRVNSHIPGKGFGETNPRINISSDLSNPHVGSVSKKSEQTYFRYRVSLIISGIEDLVLAVMTGYSSAGREFTRIENALSGLGVYTNTMFVHIRLCLYWDFLH